MKYNPLTGHLWNNDGKFLKTLNCPYAVSAAQITDSVCTICHYSIMSTEDLTDAETTEIMDANPGQCISLNLSAQNIRVVFDEN